LLGCAAKKVAHQGIFYERLSSLPNAEFSAFGRLKNIWLSQNNAITLQSLAVQKL
jgi:hypothetical protein